MKLYLFSAIVLVATTAAGHAAERTKPGSSDLRVSASVTTDIWKMTPERRRVILRQAEHRKVIKTEPYGVAVGHRVEADESRLKDFQRALQADTDLYFSDDRRTNASTLRDACAGGTWNACTALGKMYLAGDGTWPDQPLAIAFLLQGCAADDGSACNELYDIEGLGYDSAYIGSRPHVGYFRRRCERDDPQACEKYGAMLRYGYGVLEKDERRAREVLAKACALGAEKSCTAFRDYGKEFEENQVKCDQDDSRACYSMFWHFWQGKGVGRDIEAGLPFGRKSCELGFAFACELLADRLIKDPKEKLALYRSACDAQSPKGCVEWSDLIEDGFGGKIDQDLIWSIREKWCTDKLYNRGCSDLRAKRSEAAAAKIDVFDPKQDATFHELIRPEAKVAREQCASGDDDACKALGDLYVKRRGNFGRELAQRLYRRYCDQGDRGACVALALADPRDKKRLLSDACDSGFASGCVHLAIHSRRDMDDAQRFDLFKFACTAGDAEGCAYQGEVLGNPRNRFGIAVPLNRERAFRLFQLACGQGAMDGCVSWARVIDPTIGNEEWDHVPKDSKKSLELYERACAARQATACWSLGYRYQSGETTPIDLPRSLNYYGLTCAYSGDCKDEKGAVLRLERSNLRAEHGAVPSALIERYVDFIPKYHARVRRARRDCRSDDMRACFDLANYFYASGGEHGFVYSGSDSEWGTALAMHACDRDFADACNRLGDLFEYSDPPLSLTYSQKACVLNQEASCYRLATFHYWGKFGPKDYAAALPYYALSCALGYAYSCDQVSDWRLEGFVTPAQLRDAESCEHGDGKACLRLAQP